MTVALMLAAGACGGPARDGAAGPACAGGAWQPGALEIHHLALGAADATLIVGPTGRSLLVDVGESGWDRSAGAELVGAQVEATLGCRRLDYVLLTHFHLDHTGAVGRGGLWHLVHDQGFSVGKTIHRDLEAYAGDGSRTLDLWRAYLAGEGADRLHPAIAEEGPAQIDLGPGVAFTIVATDGNGALARGRFTGDPAPPSENDYSIAATLRFGAFDYFIGGDLSGERLTSPFGYGYHDIETTVAREVGDVDVYRADHHGSDHSSNPVLLAELDPEVSIISVGDGNTHQHPRPEAVRRLLATGAVYLTERGALRADLAAQVAVGGPVLVRTLDGRRYTVNGDAYEATDPPRVDGDGDGYFREADPDDGDPFRQPAPRGGCDPVYQRCGATP